MVQLTPIIRQASAKMRQMFSKDPLRRPLGRVPDSVINKALTLRNMGRADLFTRGKTLAPHRRRLAAMMAVHRFSPRQIAARHWRELKLADHLCAHCTNKKRCDEWLQGRHYDHAPRRFCPNVTTFERWRRASYQSDLDVERTEGDDILEAGLAQTREILKRPLLQKSLRFDP